MPQFRNRVRAIAAVLALLLCGAPGARGGDGLAELARDAYIYTFPLHEMYRVRYLSLYTWVNPQRVAVNHFAHRRALSDHTSRRVTTPNNDTIYSSAFLDLAGGPLVLDVPAVENRYYALAFMDFYTNNFAYIGTRKTGSGAGRYVIVGPAAKDAAIPAGAQRIVSPTDAVWLLGRFLVVDESDLPNVHRLQDALKLAPLGAGGTPRFDGPAVDADDPWNYFAVVNHALTQNPPPARDAALMARFAAINVGPGQRFDPTRWDAAQQQALRAGIDEAKRAIAVQSVSGTVVNGWAYGVPGVGNFGTDYLLRAATALKGLGALEPAEASYLTYVGAPLDPGGAYRMHFDAGQLPPVAAFWSLSIYQVEPDGRGFFADNPIRRYSIGDRTPGLQHNPDGSLDIFIQHAAPGAAQASNSLPAPAGTSALILRAYIPGPQLLDRSYAPPPLTRER
jgi:hypothetical protein